MSTRKFIKKLTASLLFIAVVMSFGVQSAFAESNSIGHGFISPDHSASICNWK